MTVATENSVSISIPNLDGVRAKVNTRYAISGVFLGANGVGAATDGRIVLAFHHEPAPMSAIVNVPKFGAEGARIEYSGDYIHSQPLNKSKPGAMTKTEAVEGTFPPMADLVSPDDDRDWIHLNPNFLASLGKALATHKHKGVSIGIQRDDNGKLRSNRCYVVMSTDPDSKTIGLIMPINPGDNLTQSRYQRNVKETLQRVGSKA